MSKGIQVEVWGPYALFTRPELKVERVSYDIITPSAARGLIEAIYWHPGLRWHIDRIHLLSPIAFTNIRRNEVKSKLSASTARSAMMGTGKMPALYTGEDIQQRASLSLIHISGARKRTAPGHSIQGGICGGGARVGACGPGRRGISGPCEVKSP